MPADTALAALLRRDRVVILTSLFVIAFLAWACLFWFASAMKMDMPGPAMGMPGMAEDMSPAFSTWTFPHAVVIFAMWAIMMIGMMTPSVAPVVLLYTRTALGAQAQGKVFAAASWFAAGYLAAWIVFALAATAGQWTLDWLALLTPMMKSASRIFGGLLLIAAGVYQWTPLKQSCLNHCRAPLHFIVRHGGFRPGEAASLRLGMLHGAYCVGCCWALMLLLFVGGVMNLFWIAALMILVLLEKIAPWGRVAARVAGLLAAGGGALMMAGY
jgi:predicted metal-binding membrane protein